LQRAFCTGSDGFALDINHWLLEHGWAVPGLYNSMTERELNVARSLSNRAAMDNLGLYKSSYYKNKLVKFEKDLVVRHKVDPKSFKLYEDKGDVMNPKFFRRQATFESKEANNPTGTEFRDSLLADKSYRGLTWTTFSALKASERKDPDALKKQSVLLGSLISKTGKLPKADDLIYIEEAADIVDSKGKIINDWDFPLPSLPSNKKSTKKKSKK
jgi:hypothetical protein